MTTTTRDFFNNLNVDKEYFLCKFRKIGVTSRFFFTDADLKNIIENLPVYRYKSAMIVERSKEILEENKRKIDLAHNR